MLAGSLPVGDELVVVQRGPLADETERTGRKASAEFLRYCEVDRGCKPSTP